MAVINVSRENSNKLSEGLLATAIKGVWQTSKTFVRQLLGIDATNTHEWPDVEATYSPRFKGIQYLTKRDDGSFRCTACFLCATNCPAQCINIVAEESKDHHMEKRPAIFEIDILRCVFCGYCEEACPLDAIRMGSEYATAGYASCNWIYSFKKELCR